MYICIDIYIFIYIYTCVYIHTYTTAVDANTLSTTQSLIQCKRNALCMPTRHALDRVAHYDG